MMSPLAGVLETGERLPLPGMMPGDSPSLLDPWHGVRHRESADRLLVSLETLADVVAVGDALGAVTHQPTDLLTGDAAVFQQRSEGPPQCVEGVPDPLPVARVEASADTRGDQILAEGLG